MSTTQITHLAARVTDSAQSIAEDLARFAARAGQGKFLGDEARTLTEAMLRLTWQASRLDGMREIAELHAAEEQS
jgi:hypothetical protein